MTHAHNTKQLRLHYTLVVSRYFEILIVVIIHTELQPRLVCQRIAVVFNTTDSNERGSTDSTPPLESHWYASSKVMLVEAARILQHFWRVIGTQVQRLCWLRHNGF